MLELHLSEAVDRLITVPISKGGGFEARPYMLDLYEAAREKMGAPLCFWAAQRLSEEILKESFVIFLTGVIEPLTLHPAPDGPLGAAVLARALALQFEAIPVVLTEAGNLEALSMALKLAGLSPTNDVNMAREKKNKALILTASLELEEARAQAIQVMDQFHPRAVISIEKFGRNEKGVYHAGVGIDVSNLCAKVDEVVEEAKRRGIFTLGIGDLGNEIGLGLIKDTVREVVATGRDCGCPCHGGIATATETSALVVASVSNWGAYGVAACLAARHQFPDLLHTPEMERRLIEGLTSTFTPDSLSGLLEPFVDGVPLNVHIDIVDLLNTTLRLRLTEGWRHKRYREWTKQLRP